MFVLFRKAIELPNQVMQFWLLTNQYIVEKKIHSISSKSQKIIDRQNKLYGIYSVVVKRQDKKEKGFHNGKIELYIVIFLYVYKTNL